jgi:hypothetical protein
MDVSDGVEAFQRVSGSSASYRTTCVVVTTTRTPGHLHLLKPPGPGNESLRRYILKRRVVRLRV